MMRVALIFPKVVESIADGSLTSLEKKNWLTNQVKTHLFGFGETNFIPPMVLLSLAAVTPASVDLIVVDERIQDVDFEMDVDLVGISVITLTAFRAYDIASRFRKRGIPVVFGGIHPTVLPAEALQYADAVVVGEGEGVWPQLLRDASAGALKKIYRADTAIPLELLPSPRLDLLPHPERYVTTKVVRATRGCPYACTFCTVGTPAGWIYRKRPIRDIVRDIGLHPGKYMFFLDDNLGVDIDYAKNLFRAVKPLNLKWYGSVSIDALEDCDFIEAAADSGCKFFGIGFESLSKHTLKAMGKLKTNNPDRYKEIIRRVHDHGIAIVGYFLMGYDTDVPEDYDQLAEFLLETGIEIPSISALTPYPGAPITRKLEREGRILHRRWNLYYDRWWDLAFEPKTMTPQEIFESYLKMMDRVFSLRPVIRRSLPHVRGLNPIALTYILQHGYDKQKTLKTEKTYQQKIFTNGLHPPQSYSLPDNYLADSDIGFRHRSN